MSRSQDKKTTAALAMLSAVHAAGQRMTVAAAARACKIDRVTLHRALVREQKKREIVAK